MKKTIFLSMLCTLLLTTAAMAVTVNSSQIDNFTGKPLTEGGGMSNRDSVALSNTSRYEREKKVFVYRQPSGAEIKSSVANDMITTGAVMLEIPSAIDVTLYRDGEELVDPEFSEIVSPGSYVLTTESSGMPVQILRFTILDSVSGAVYQYPMPTGFVVSEVYLNDVEQRYTPYEVDMTEEGKYRIEYYCVNTGVSYELNVTVDHTPPVLALEAVVDGVAKGPVDLSDLEDDASIYIEQDGEPISYQSTLTESGSYVVTLKDRAGNIATYKFVIQVYFNASSLMFFAMTLVAAVAIIAYILYSKKALRIR